MAIRLREIIKKNCILFTYFSKVFVRHGSSFPIFKKRWEVHLFLTIVIKLNRRGFILERKRFYISGNLFNILTTKVHPKAFLYSDDMVEFLLFWRTFFTMGKSGFTYTRGLICWFYSPLSEMLTFRGNWKLCSNMVRTNAKYL